MKLRFTSIVILLFLLQFASAQNKFDGSLVFGLNASQIDGDNWWGYDKLGLHGGLKINYGINGPWFVSLEMLYSQRGSQNKLLDINSGPLQALNLRYLELPIMALFKDWWIEKDDYFKVNAEAGFSYGYMFESTVSEGLFTTEKEGFVANDFSILLGGNYFINKHWGFGVRYTRSLNRLYKNPNSGERSLLGYFLTFRTEYQF